MEPQSEPADESGERGARGVGTSGAGPTGVSRKYSAADLARIFGDVLPVQTRDDLAAQRPASETDGAAERWYRENRPPHHGG